MAAEQDRFDFIIIGGGSAGCVLARRLIDTGEVSVLLLEAGPDDRHPLLRIPAGFTQLTGTRYTWGYETAPQAGLAGKRVWYPQARAGRRASAGYLGPVRRDAHDVTRSIAGVRLARRIMAQEAFAPWIKGEAHPGAGAGSDAEIEEYALRHAKTDYHPVGICRMEAAEDPAAVVSRDLRVKEVEGLRICDSSTMPFVTSSNTNAPTIMIAEKAAEMICTAHGLRSPAPAG